MRGDHSGPGGSVKRLRGVGMAGITHFLQSLRNPDWDAVVLVFQDLQDSTAPDRIRTLENYARTLRGEIDEVNRKRDVLGQKVDNLNLLLGLVDKQITDDPSDLELTLLRDVLQGWRASLRAEIAGLRPDNKLKKRDDTERKCDLLKRLRTTVDSLNRLIVEANPPSRVRSTCVPKKERAR